MSPRSTVIVPCLVLTLAACAYAGTLQIVPTTTLAAETANNTSASPLFTSTTSNGDLGVSNVSKVDIHSLVYPGYSGQIYAHLMGWFCMNSGSSATGGGTKCGSHLQVGYNSSDPAQVQAQVADMMSRGINGVIHDWYGQGSNSDVEAQNMIAEAEQHPGFTYAIMIDKGAISWYSCYPTCTATQALTQIAQYAANKYFASPAYLRAGGRPVFLTFGVAGGFSIDWNYVATNTPGNPMWLFQNAGGFTKAQSSGAYAWVMPDDPNYGLDYLAGFYGTGNSYPALYTIGATYKGFNDTLASWTANRIMDQQCGQTWLQTFGQINTTTQLDAIQLVTWDDYEEGTEIESGINNCVTVSGSTAGSTLNWAITGNENTIDHYTVFISTDGQNLMPLGDFAAGVHQLDLSPFSPGPGSYTLYVKAVGKPSLRNQMSAAIGYTVAGTLIAPTALLSVSATTAVAPATITASTSGSVVDRSTTIVSSVINWGDGTSSTGATAAHTYSIAGTYNVTATVTDGLGKSSTATQSVTINPALAIGPKAVLSLSATTAVAPATITASTSGSVVDPSTTIASSIINWGDGTSSAAATASHVYNTAGAYTVTATVTDGLGKSSTATQALTVKPAAVYITAPANGATLTSPVHVTAYAVSGRAVDSMIIYLDSADAYLTYSSSLDTYLSMAPGTHTILIKSWDKTGAITRSQVTISIVNAVPLGPTAALSLSNKNGLAPLSVTASTSGSTDASAIITASIINWGDGTSSAATTVSHAYGKPGVYTVTGTVTDGKGLSASKSAKVNVAGIVISSPLAGVSSTSPVLVAAKAVDANAIDAMYVYVDGVTRYWIYSNSFSTYLSMSPGTHKIVIKAWESQSNGLILQSTATVTVY